VLPDEEVKLNPEETTWLYQQWRFQDREEEPEAEEAEKEPPEEFTDRQLDKALEVLRTKIAVGVESNV
jgi:hypothetical protein